MKTKAKSSKKANPQPELRARASHDPSATTTASKAAEAASMGPKELREFRRKRKPWGIDDGSVRIDAWVYGGRE